MKKKALIAGAIVLVAITFVSLYFVFSTPRYTGAFSVGDYQEEMENIYFQTDESYGDISNYMSAAKAGKTAIAQRFETTEGHLFRWRGCSVQYDEENSTYLVSTYYVSPLRMGGRFCVILQSDGTVLSIWGDK